MSYTLIICEKPSASKSIAESLSDGKPKKIQEENSKAYYFKFTKDGKDFVTAPAVGHLFTLKQVGKGWDYPVFDLEWIPSYKANRLAAFSEPYFRNLEKLASGAKDVIVATDYDDEGEVIGFNILKFICGMKNAPRMKFSTMTKEELIESYSKMKKNLNKDLIDSGLARHYMDFYWGISITRALTNSIKKIGNRFRILSTGRVQGPVLNMLTKHEKKIQAFKPKPFWQVDLEITKDKKVFTVQYQKDKIWDKDQADVIVKKSKGIAEVVDLKNKKSSQKPPVPYNTTAMLADIYRYFGYSPQQALSIAEALYQSGLISYPRTNSQKLPKDIKYKKIIKSLGNQKEYLKESEFLLSLKELVPNEGKAMSQAHPAIYPTGQRPSRMGSKQKKVYDLVVRRFLACFGSVSKREASTVKLDLNGNIFLLKGTKIIEKGWMNLYGKYASVDEVVLPIINKGDKFKVKKTNLISKKTKPPARFSQGSVLKEMEEKGLGTQATRASIIQILYNRGYIIGKSIEVTTLGLQLSNILSKNIPEVVSEDLTKEMEQKTQTIEDGKLKMDDFLQEVKGNLVKISKKFKKKEKKIGQELTDAVIATQDKQNIMGPCHKCKGGTLKLNKMWNTGKRFIGCSNYKKGKCTFGAPAPREGIMMSLDKNCPECKSPIVQVNMPGKRPFRMCLEITCPTKKDWLDKKKLKKAVEESKASKT